MEENRPLAREIRKYNIMSLTYLRGTGSRFGGHERRALWDLCGKPMFQWSLEASLASKYINKTALGCEDPEIVKVAERIDGVTIIPRQINSTLTLPRDWNVGVFQKQRPRSLFSGETFAGSPEKASGILESHSITNFPIYCLWHLQEYESFVTDIWLNMPANEPLVSAESVDRLIEAFFLDEEANAAYAVYAIMPGLFTINPSTKRLFPAFFHHGLDRQCYPPLYRIGPPLLYGSAGKSTYGETFKMAYIIISKEEGIDVHNEEDLALANYYMKRRLSRQKCKEGGDS